VYPHPSADLAVKRCIDTRVSLADEVEGDIGEGDILFEYRAVAAPFADALAEDEGVVCEVEEVFDFSVHDGD